VHTAVLILDFPVIPTLATLAQPEIWGLAWNSLGPIGQVSWAINPIRHMSVAQTVS
jgi:hypothetical protein